MAEHEAINNARRKINEVLKKNSEQITVGWRPGLEPTRQEGDTWTDLNDKKWVMKNGIKQTVTKLDGAKTPWYCPQCEKTMGHRFDIKFWGLRGKCMECVIKEETEMRRLGTWKEYEERKIKENYIAALKDRIAELQSLHDTVTAPEVIHADETKILMIEKWHVDIDKVKADIMKDIEELNGFLTEVEAGG